jgi:hypothetical protein
MCAGADKRTDRTHRIADVDGCGVRIVDEISDRPGRPAPGRNVTVAKAKPGRAAPAARGGVATPRQHDHACEILVWAVGWRVYFFSRTARRERRGAGGTRPSVSVSLAPAPQDAKSNKVHRTETTRRRRWTAPHRARSTPESTPHARPACSMTTRPPVRRGRTMRCDPRMPMTTAPRAHRRRPSALVLVGRAAPRPTDTVAHWIYTSTASATGRHCRGVRTRLRLWTPVYGGRGGGPPLGGGGIPG